MTRSIILSAVGTFVLLSSASAAEVRGTLKSTVELKDETKQVVVWVEGVKDFEKPTKNPVMSQSGIQFSPRVMVVTAGQTVDMPNNDDVAHNVFSLSRTKKFNLGIYPKGKSKSVTFEKIGVIDLFCKIHRHMHAVVVVTPSPHAATAAIGKEYVIKNVPAGTFKLHTWNSKLGHTVQPITIAGEKGLTVNLELKPKTKK